MSGRLHPLARIGSSPFSLKTMESWLKTVADWLPGGNLYYALIGTISFLESVALLGIFVPGSVFIVFAGFLATHGKGSIVWHHGRFRPRGHRRRPVELLGRGPLGVPPAEVPLLSETTEASGKSPAFFCLPWREKRSFRTLHRLSAPLYSLRRRQRPHVALAVCCSTPLSAGCLGPRLPGPRLFFRNQLANGHPLDGRFSFLIALLLGLFILNGVFWKWIAPFLGRGIALSVYAEASGLWECPAAEANSPGLRRASPSALVLSRRPVRPRAGFGTFSDRGFFRQPSLCLLFSPCWPGGCGSTPPWSLWITAFTTCCRDTTIRRAIFSSSS